MNFKKQCPVCSAKDAQFLFPVKTGQLIKCSQCHLIYFTPRPSLQQLEEFYNSEDYRNEFSESLMSGTEFATNRYLHFEKALKKYIPKILNQPSRKLLDIGCGTGDFLKAAQDHNWQVSGTEISSLASTKANQKLGKDCIISGEILSLNLPYNHYDVITLYHVIEHLINPNLLIQKAYQLLKPGGIFFIETPNIAGFGAKIKGKEWSQIKPPEHITYFQPNSLRYCLQLADFKTNFIFTASPSIIESTKDMSPIKRKITNAFYQFFPLINMGALLQSISIKTQ
ncbi:bifunctional 2-polyprenyl-6-hydroxyphenol methylase/3-demethylubiquinol 3-O-methyltransferase UbiG [Picosynechococcus sp. NKBG15041c]|uniref:class I SAM-dependent methyltransferase n=1 Tax=Picosynechococcus sp. NKBG15041c TaxID=1407650 RepID=UPI00046753E6|nr:class I SAM-dependent methyltransferase [Picosynechococcus sp. NKBG15041c]